LVGFHLCLKRKLLSEEEEERGTKMFYVNKSPVDDTHFWMWCPQVINVKGTYVKHGKIILPNCVDTDKLVFR